MSDLVLRKARLAFEARDRDATADEIAALLRDDRSLNVNWGAVSRLASTIGEVKLAIAAARRAAASDSANIAQALQFGAVLAGFGRVEEAMSIGEGLLARLPNDPAVLHFCGTCVSQLGDLSRAEDLFRRALKIRPQAVETWLNLSTVKKFSAGDPDLAALQAIVRRSEAAPPEARATLFYALGKALDDTGAQDASFAAYEEGAALMRPLRRYNAQASAAYVSDVCAGFTQDFVNRLEPSDAVSDRPIFVLGAPRSGTTLVEQILAAHSEVAGGGEINLFMPTVLQLRGYAPAAIEAGLAAMPRPGGYWTRAAVTYLRLIGEHVEAPGRIIDKTLTNTRILGIILHTLPQARVIWMRRDPDDNALSCFRLHVAGGLNWSWSLTDIAAFFKDEDRLWAHWQSVFPDRILTVPYESLVRDPETWIPRVLAHCSLEDQPATRTFYEVNRAVQSASVSQVRRPLSASSIGIADRIPDQMRAFTEAYR